MSTVRKRGDSWQAIVRVKQRGVIVFQESASFKGPKGEQLARGWADKLEARLLRDGVPTATARVATLGGLLRSYAATRDSIKPLRRSMEHELEQLAVDFADTRLDQLRAETFARFAARRREAGAGPTTILHNLATVRSVLNAAKPMYGLDVDGGSASEAIASLGRLGAVGRSQSRDRRPTSAELAALGREFARIAPNPSTIIPMEKVVDLAVHFPRRLGELTDMRWLDYVEGIVTLRETKNPRAPRTEKVPVPPKAAAIIASLPVIDERILPYKSESVSASFQRACERLKIVDLHFHDLRHEGITRLFESGLSIQEVALISGHQSWAMLKRYTHLKPSNVLDKMNASHQEAPKATPQPP